MKTTWWRDIGRVLWLGVFGLLWALGAWLPLALIADCRAHGEGNGHRRGNVVITVP